MSDHDRIPDLLLERYRLGELPPADASALERRLAADAEARERLHEIERAEGEIRRQHPPEWLAGQVRARLAARRLATPAARPSRPRLAWSAALASAAALVLVVVMQRPWPTGDGVPVGGQPGAVTPAVTVPGTNVGQPGAAEPGEAPAPAPAATGSAAPSATAVPATPATDGHRLKGLQPALALYRRTTAGSEALADGARARKGDVLRLGYRAAGRAYGAIVSIDGRGAVTRHLPAQGTHAVELQAGPVLLDESYELDDAPRFERFYLAVAEEPFEIAPLLEAVKRAAGTPRLDLPDVFEQSTFSIEKEETR